MRRQVRTAIGAGLRGAADERALRRAGRRARATRCSPRSIRTIARRSRSPRPVSIRYAATEDMFAVAVRDRFGRLAKNTILSYIEKCIHSPNQIDRKTYGAGLGLYLVANAAASYVVNVAYGIATEVVCTFDRGAKSAAAARRRVRPPGRRGACSSRGRPRRRLPPSRSPARWLSASSGRTGSSARSRSAGWPRSISRRRRASRASRSTSRSR